MATMVAALIAGRADADSGQDAALQTGYAIPASRFITIDGTPIHYADEGKGPVILLLHGSFASLRQWDGWAARLRRQYRVVRFDMPPAGLSGPAPDADYGIDARLRIVEALRSRLGLERVLLVATSSGAITSAAYAAQHPERLSGLILNNAGVGPLHLNPAAFPPALRAAIAADAVQKSYHSDEFWRQVMLYHFVDRKRVTPALVRQWTELNNRALTMPPSPAGRGGVSHDRTPADLTRIETPTLLLWSSDDKEVPVEADGRRGLALLAAKDKQLIVVPRCGHMMPLDCGDRALAQAMPFVRRVAGR